MYTIVYYVATVLTHFVRGMKDEGHAGITRLQRPAIFPCVKTAGLCVYGMPHAQMHEKYSHSHSWYWIALLCHTEQWHKGILWLALGSHPMAVVKQHYFNLSCVVLHVHIYHDIAYGKHSE